jgi:hypothetical protein
VQEVHLFTVTSLVAIPTDRRHHCGVELEDLECLDRELGLG